MTAHKCSYCGEDCDALPNKGGFYVCAVCIKGALPEWTQQEKEDLFSNVFGSQTRVPEG